MTLPDGSLHPVERQLLDELGDLDPVQSQVDTLAGWKVLLADAGPLAGVAPVDGEWSALQVLGHLVEAEVVNALRYRAMIVEDCPMLERYDRDLWRAMLQRPADAAVGSLLAMFAALRRANLTFWDSLDGAGRARTAIDPGCGVETIELRFRMLAGHDRMHLAQAEAAVRAAAESAARA